MVSDWGWGLGITCRLDPLLPSNILAIGSENAALQSAEQLAHLVQMASRGLLALRNQGAQLVARLRCILPSAPGIKRSSVNHALNEFTFCDNEAEFAVNVQRAILQV
jgi:hypothetical protein